MVRPSRQVFLVSHFVVPFLLLSVFAFLVRVCVFSCFVSVAVSDVLMF